MPSLPTPVHLDALRHGALLDAPAEAAFDRLGRLATTILRVPLARVSLVNQNRDFLKTYATASAARTARRAPLPPSVPHPFCRHVVASGEPFLVEDARVHPLGSSSLAVKTLGSVAYLGVPLTTAGGQRLGTFSVVDTVPRMWTTEEVALLTDLAGAAATELELLSEVTERRRAERALQESETRFRNAFDHSAIGMALVAPEGHWLRVNSALCGIVGYSANELLGLTVQDITHPDDLEAVADYARQMLHGEIQTCQMEQRYFHKRGHVIWVLLTASVVYDAAGAPQHFISQVQDITERKHAEEAQARLTAILEATPDIVAVGMRDGRLPYLNAAGRRLLGLGDRPDADALTVKDVHLRLVNGGTLRRAIHIALRDGVWRGETMLRKRDGRELPAEQVILAHASSDGSVEYFSTIVRDISERKQVEATLRALSLVDELTGLHNRRGFMTLAEQEWKRAQRGGWPLLVFYIDVDDFKQINDGYGHAEGDAALVAVATILRATFREADVIARFGGDEFTVLALHGGGGTAEAVTTRLQQRLAEHNVRAGRPYALALSVGVAQSATSASDSLESLIAQADVALYEQKRARKQERRA